MPVNFLLKKKVEKLRFSVPQWRVGLGPNHSPHSPGNLKPVELFSNSLGSRNAEESSTFGWGHPRPAVHQLHVAVGVAGAQGLDVARTPQHLQLPVRDDEEAVLV